MFQFPGFPLIHYVFMYEYLRSSQAGFPIQKSAGQWIFAPYRSLSQLITSFIGSQCLGIHPAPFMLDLSFGLPFRHSVGFWGFSFHELLRIPFGKWIRLPVPFQRSPLFRFLVFLV